MGAWRDSTASREPTDRRDAERCGADWLVGAARGDLLGRLSDGLVHEARNPLNAIAIHLEVLADKLRDEETGLIPAHLTRNLDAARGQVRRLDELLCRYGEFAGGPAGQEGDGLAACLARAAALCEFHLRRAGLSIEIDVPQDVALHDPDRTSQLVLEMLLLAVGRAAQGSGIVLSGRAEGDSVLIGLSGMRDESKSDDSNSTAVDAIYAIVEALGGEITLEVESEWLWSLRLPAAAGSKEAIT